MTEEPPPPAMWAKAHRVMMEQTIRMDNLVNQLLTLSRIEAAPTVDLSHLVDMPAMLGLLEQEARALSGERAHQIEFVVQPNLLVRGDQKITVEWRKQGAMALFAVSDEGEGIAPEHLARLTERFYRVDKARSRHTGGSGLGLAIVKHALSHHDCQLDIESRVGLGSRFSFLIPSRMVVIK